MSQTGTRHYGTYQPVNYNVLNLTVNSGQQRYEYLNQFNHRNRGNPQKPMVLLRIAFFNAIQFDTNDVFANQQLPTNQLSKIMRKTLTFLFSLISLAVSAQGYIPSDTYDYRAGWFQNDAFLTNGPYNRPFVTTRNFTERNPNAVASNGTDLLQTYKMKRPIVQNCTDIQLAYTNISTDPVSVTVSVQTSAGIYYPIYYQGKRVFTIEPNGFILTDPLSVNFAKGDFLWVLNTVGVSASGLKWYKPQVVNDAGGSAAVAGADYTAGGGTYTQNAVVYSPVAIIGRTMKRVPVIAGIGDSIMFGQGANQEEGFLQPFGANYSTIQMGQPGSAINNYTANAHKKAMLLASCTAAICEGGYNNIFQSNNTLPIVQSEMIACWRSLAFRGIRVFQTTITPRTSSTDNWATTANQSIADAAKEGVRTGVNDWLRDGAPVNSSYVAVAIGTTVAGTLRIGQVEHPLTGYFDVADKLETARNSGIWKVSPTLTADGTHPNVTGNVVAVSAFDITAVTAFP